MVLFLISAINMVQHVSIKENKIIKHLWSILLKPNNKFIYFSSSYNKTYQTIPNNPLKLNSSDNIWSSKEDQEKDVK